jgi:hypothetical protein
MGKLAKVMQGQSQPGLKMYKKGGEVCPGAAPATKKAAPMKPAMKKGGKVGCK